MAMTIVIELEEWAEEILQVMGQCGRHSYHRWWAGSDTALNRP
jgi:hypothetical protein